MNRLATLAAIIAAAATAGAAHASSPGLTEADVDTLKRAWGEGIVNIGAVGSASRSTSTSSARATVVFPAVRVTPTATVSVRARRRSASIASPRG